MRYLLFLLATCSIAWADLDTEIAQAQATLDSLLAIKSMATGEAARLQVQAAIDTSLALQSLGLTVTRHPRDPSYVSLAFAEATGFKRALILGAIDEYQRGGATRTGMWSFDEQPAKILDGFVRLRGVLE